MSAWKSTLRAHPIEWLLEKDSPPVKYFASTDLVEKSVDDQDVIETRKAIMETGLVPSIMGRQEEGGYWGIAQYFYIKSKYKGTVWTFIILAEPGADAGQE